MELLAAMRLDLAQEFSQNVDVTQLLQCLPIQPQDYLFNRLRGCDKHCPLCGAPCEVEEMGHTVHKAMLHRPKDWSISPEQMPSAYWRYVLVRFNEKFAEKYEREPAKIPDKWKMITVEEARDSLNDAFLSGQY
ncbi:hypothetical protein GBF38_012322 [Nibea albiflora]|uniref:Uncharacterized protein n=1 Tax=Nibea albiflora TaxID=240163 RepID=A0ACB7EK44_NIBAL|nr:hypothetical protein GBF38_012322 [Nibea albiflora]